MKQHGIDISTAVRPGGTPTHVVSQGPSAAPGTQHPIARIIGNAPRTIDPIGWFTRGRKTLGKRLQG